jgi:hypothetical protein
MNRNDDDLIARVDASNRMMWRLVWTLSGGLALVAAAVAALVFTGYAEWQQNGWFQLGVAAVVGALFLYVLVMMGRHQLPPMEVLDPALARRRIDAKQRRWRTAMLLNIFTLFICVFNIAPELGDNAGLHGILPFALGFAICALPTTFAFLLSGGPGLRGLGQPDMRALVNDEFAVALRGRTMRFGYLFLMLALSAVLLIVLWRPALIFTALAWALYAGFAIPALYYVIADWRAGREE